MIFWNILQTYQEHICKETFSCFHLKFYEMLRGYFLVIFRNFEEVVLKNTSGRAQTKVSYFTKMAFVRLPSYWNMTKFKGTPMQIRKSYNILVSVPQNLLTNDFSTNLYIWHRLSKYLTEFALVKVLRKSGANIHKKKGKMNICIICTTLSTLHTQLWMWRA